MSAITRMFLFYYTALCKLTLPIFKYNDNIHHLLFLLKPYHAILDMWYIHNVQKLHSLALKIVFWVKMKGCLITN